MIVTICGSTRFRAEMQMANRQLTLAGHVVLAPGVFQHDGDEITEQQKRLLDQLHFYKIDLSEAIFVVNPNGYIGESTKREIRYATETGKKVEYLKEMA
jgi:dienelactone hydrolase